MRQLVRLLMMFGPMIFRQIQKYQRNKERKQGYATPDQLPRNNRKNNRDYDQGRDPARGRRRDPREEEYIRHEPVAAEPQMTQEEKNFNLDEEDIMLDKEDLTYTKNQDIASEFETEKVSDYDADFETNVGSDFDLDLDLDGKSES